ncbi:MAG: DUF134 domain-containing protein [Candidatus Paceibacterota bacterium]|jgi:predicted DNA-binding protein (UPF0251 family)
MSRPRLRRRVRFNPTVEYFKPQGIPLRLLAEVELSFEEMEVIRLKDFVGLGQVEAAKKMETSQSTFQRILTIARQKIADAIINGKAIKIEKK